MAHRMLTTEERRDIYNFYNDIDLRPGAHIHMQEPRQKKVVRVDSVYGTRKTCRRKAN